MFLVYKNFEIQSTEYQGTDCFQVKTPDNKKWPDLAANISTAKKWIDQHLAEKGNSYAKK